MFERDEYLNFWKQESLKQVFGKLFIANTPIKEKPFTYYIVKKACSNKKFLRITNNFFIEI